MNLWKIHYHIDERKMYRKVNNNQGNKIPDTDNIIKHALDIILKMNLEKNKKISQMEYNTVYGKSKTTKKVHKHAKGVDCKKCNGNKESKF